MLDLNPVQQQRIKAILSAAELKTEQLRSNTTLVPEEKGPQMRRIHEETREQIEAVLTPAQREKMQQSRERGRPPRHFG
jgi:Spy/CpxP family protein refolding chaperone